MTTPSQALEQPGPPDQINEGDKDDDDDDDFAPRLISRQGGVTIREIFQGVVQKRGNRVTRNEETALRLVEESTSVPVPSVHIARYFHEKGVECGSIIMDLVDGFPLNKVWSTFDDNVKRRICLDIWDIARQLRQIQRPAAFAHLYQCGADGSPSIDILLEDLHKLRAPICSDEDLRARIYQRYLRYNGGSYPEDLPALLPQSSVSVFTHGDLTPRNIIVDDTGRIKGVVDWENAGWYPDYWEYANIMKPSMDEDWMAWMDRTKPTPWNIEGIAKARRVLF